MDNTQADTPASNLPDFEAGVSYDVQMARPVEFPAGSGNWLRPDHRVTMDGALAAKMEAGDILGAGKSPEA